MNVGDAMLDLVVLSGGRSVAVVGMGKNVGKTVTMRALYEAAIGRGLRVGVVSAGRDGEAIDAIDRNPKPRLRLAAGTWIASAPRTMEPLEESTLPRGQRVETACGPLVIGRVARADDYELVGPPTALGLRIAIEALSERCEFVLVDGAIDRLATIEAGPESVIVACGAAAAPTMEDAVDGVRDVVERLQIPAPDPSEPSVRIPGALLAGQAGELIAASEKRQIVVHSPASIVLAGKAWAQAREHLRLRVERPVRVLAVTVAPEYARRRFDPAAFLDRVARTTRLPAYDVVAGTHVDPSKVVAWSR